MRNIDIAVYCFFTFAALFSIWSLTHTAIALRRIFREMQEEMKRYDQADRLRREERNGRDGDGRAPGV